MERFDGLPVLRLSSKRVGVDDERVGLLVANGNRAHRRIVGIGKLTESQIDLRQADPALTLPGIEIDRVAIRGARVGPLLLQKIGFAQRVKGPGFGLELGTSRQRRRRCIEEAAVKLLVPTT